MFAQIIEQSENSTVDQNSEVLGTVADYSTELAMFVGDSNVVINDTVSHNYKQLINTRKALICLLSRLLKTWSKW